MVARGCDIHGNVQFFGVEKRNELGVTEFLPHGSQQFTNRTAPPLSVSRYACIEFRLAGPLSLHMALIGDKLVSSM